MLVSSQLNHELLMLVFTLSLTGSGARLGAAEPIAPIRLTLVWMDPAGLLRFGFQPMADEVRDLFGDVGIDIDWRKEPSLQAADDTLLEIVINVRPSATGWNLGEHAMGAVLKGDTRQRVVYIFFDNILRTLDLDYRRSRLPSATETGELAQAIAYVVCHEVVHSIDPEAPHAEGGLMRFQLTRARLRSSRLRLSIQSTRALHASLRNVYKTERNPTRKDSKPAVSKD